MSKVIVIGDVMLDVVTRALEPVAPTSDAVARVRVGRGGSAANMAVVLAGAGHDVTYVGAVGTDVAGAMIAVEFERAGVRPWLQTLDGETGVVVALVASDGQRAMMTDRGVNSRLGESHVRRALADPFDHLHVSGYTLLDEATRATGSLALSLARDARATTSVDVCSVAPLRRVTPGVFLDAARPSSFLFANEEEALTLSGGHDVASATRILVGHFDEVVVTEGARGAVAATAIDHHHVDARSAEALDTTGAGDAATGAYLAARLRGEDIEVALTGAMAMAAQVVGHLGAT